MSRAHPHYRCSHRLARNLVPRMSLTLERLQYRTCDTQGIHGFVCPVCPLKRSQHTTRHRLVSQSCTRRFWKNQTCIQKLAAACGAEHRRGLFESARRMSTSLLNNTNVSPKWVRQSSVDVVTSLRYRCYATSKPHCSWAHCRLSPLAPLTCCSR